MGVDGLSCGTHRASARGVDFAVIAVLVAPKDLGLNTPKNFNSFYGIRAVSESLEFLRGMIKRTSQGNKWKAISAVPIGKYKEVFKPRT